MAAFPRPVKTEGGIVALLRQIREGCRFGHGTVDHGKRRNCCCCCGDGRGSGYRGGGEDPQKGIHNLLERIRNAHSLVRISPSFWSGLLLRKYTRNTEIEVNMEFI